jgi:predicted membrane channel-forming protein YqfA (hemolysin III family)
MHHFFDDHRNYSAGETRADALVHGAGIVGALAGSIILLAHAGVSWVLASYLFGLLAMMIFSAAYNLTPPSHLKWLPPL